MNSKLYNKEKIIRSCWLFTVLLLLSNLFGCKKLVAVDPPIYSTTGSSVYNLDNTAISAVTGLFANISQNNNFISGRASLSMYSGLSADELTLYSGIALTDVRSYYYTNALYAYTTGTTPGTEFWGTIYSYVNGCNQAIEGLNAANSLTTSIQKQLLGEVKFLRALCYFYLVNLYGDVPLAITADYKINAALSRASKDKIYEQIISDLTDAQDLLSANYLDGSLLSNTTERVRPNRWAATALLARAYLYTNKWTNAETQTTAIINNTSVYSLDSLNGAFLKNSKEAIWQLQPVQIGYNTQEGRMFILPATGPNNSEQFAYLSSNLRNSFETGDLRKSKWVNSVTAGGNTYYFPYKYKLGSNDTSINGNTGTKNIKEYVTVFRLAEQYLIRSEARAKQGNLSGAIADLDVIRQRAGLPLISNTNPSISQSALLVAILHERQVELFTELGQRWLDLKRTNTVDAIMTTATPQKGGVWNSSQQLYPLPLNDILKNPKLVQNNGY